METVLMWARLALLALVDIWGLLSDTLEELVRRGRLGPGCPALIQQSQ